jgi:hypothetical protein
MSTPFLPQGSFGQQGTNTFQSSQSLSKTNKVRQETPPDSKLGINLEDLSDEQFLKLFNGKDTIAGTGDSFKLASEFLMGSILPKKLAMTCLIMTSKPKKLLFTGRTKSGKGDGKPIDERVYSILPKLKEAVSTRDSWPLQARMLNISMIRMIAMIYVQYASEEQNPLVLQWLTKRSGLRPYSLATTVRDLTDETTRIEQELCEKFYQAFQFASKEVADDVHEFVIQL